MNDGSQSLKRRMAIILTTSQDALAQTKIEKRLKKTTISQNVPLYVWTLVKSWTVVRKSKGTGLKHSRLMAKYRPMAVQVQNQPFVSRAKLVKAGLPSCLTVDLGLI